MAQINSAPTTGSLGRRTVERKRHGKLEGHCFVGSVCARRSFWETVATSSGWSNPRAWLFAASTQDEP
jgi:hypothetical protein